MAQVKEYNRENLQITISFCMCVCLQLYLPYPGGNTVSILFWNLNSATT